MKICFVCHANVCRSFLAHELLKKLIEDNKISDVDVISRGIFAFENCPIPKKYRFFVEKWHRI